jgi:hypothetical protein
MTPLAAPLHHSEAGDPILFQWIKHRLDELIALEPVVIVALLGAAILAVPVTILLVYVAQRRGGLYK